MVTGQGATEVGRRVHREGQAQEGVEDRGRRVAALGREEAEELEEWEAGAGQRVDGGQPGRGRPRDGRRASHAVRWALGLRGDDDGRLAAVGAATVTGVLARVRTVCGAV